MQTWKRLARSVGLLAVLTWGAPVSAYTIDYTVAVSGENHLAGGPPGSLVTFVGSGTAHYDSDTAVLTAIMSTFLTYHIAPYIGGVVLFDRTIAFSGTEVASALTGVSASELSWAWTSIVSPNPCEMGGCFPAPSLSDWVISDIPLAGGSFGAVTPNGTATWTLTPIPEPGTLLLVAFGLAGLSVRRRRD